MVAIKSHEADRFLTKLPQHVFLYLVFGSDAGLVSERARHILCQSVADPADPFQFARMKGDDIAGDPLRLLDEANTIAMFGGTRAILIELGSKQLAPALEMLILAPPRDCTIIVEGGAITIHRARGQGWFALWQHSIMTSNYRTLPCHWRWQPPQ